VTLLHHRLCGARSTAAEVRLLKSASTHSTRAWEFTMTNPETKNEQNRPVGSNNVFIPWQTLTRAANPS
jgi:hypothetical protein